VWKRSRAQQFKLATVLIVSLFASNPTYAAASTTTTLAGGSGTLCSTTPTVGTSISASNVWGIAVGPDGSVYYPMRSSFIVCKITPDGKVVRVMGTGVAGYGTDGTAGTSFQLYNPIGVAVDAAGNVYVADYTGSYGIKKLSTSGTVTTIFNSSRLSTVSGNDGLAVNAGSSGPLAINVDANGLVYFADYSSGWVRKIDANGYVRVVAGTGTLGNSGDNGLATSARVGNISGIEFDSNGNVYISSYQCSIRKINISTGIITTIAGTYGTCTSTGDGGLASSATLNVPWGFAIDAENNIYIGGRGDCSIRKISASTGIISTVAGLSGTCADTNSNPVDSRFSYIYDLALSSAGDLVILDYGNNKVKKINAFATPFTLGSITLTASRSAIFRSTSILTANFTSSGKVTFYANGKRIPGCIGISGTTSAACNWKPSIRGTVAVQVVLAYSGQTATSSNFNVVVVSRTAPR